MASRRRSRKSKGANKKGRAAKSTPPAPDKAETKAGTPEAAQTQDTPVSKTSSPRKDTQVAEPEPKPEPKAAPEPKSEPKAAPSPPAQSKGPSEPPGRNPFAAALPWFIAAICVAASIAFSVGLTNTREELTALQASLDDASARVGSLEVGQQVADSIFDAVMQADMRTAVLSNAGTPPVIHLFWSPDQARVLLRASGLAPAPSGRTYQLWGLAAGRDAVSLGTFSPSADGTALSLFRVSEVAQFEMSAVTDEPASGSQQPTPQPQLVGTWSGPNR